MHFLNKNERVQLKVRHKKECDKCICDQEIAGVLLITDESVRNHIEDYKARQKLKAD